MPAILMVLTQLVPLLPGLIQAGKVGFDIYDTVQKVIDENRSPTVPEWDALEAQIRTDQAAVRDTSRDVPT